MDTTYWGRDFGVVMLYDCYRKKLLWRKFVNRKEVVADYLEGIGWLEKYNFKILVLSAMASKGWLNLWLDTRCSIVSFIRRKPHAVILLESPKPRQESKYPLRHILPNRFQVCTFVLIPVGS